MVLQQDKGSAPQPFDTGLPRTQSSEDVPRWLVVLGMAAACTLLVALLRYAIDLLGVVFLIILVGFSIRAVSDWLTEGESVSAWALAAVFAGLFGTVLVGFWLFGSRDMTTGALERGLPPPVLAVSDWFEAHGWGQRVLLGGGGAPLRRQHRECRGARSASAPSGGAVSPRAEPESLSAPASRASGSESSSRARKPASQASGGEAEAATTSPSGSSARRSPEPSGGGTATPMQEAASRPPVAEPVTQPAVEAASTGTSTTLVSSHSASAVGTSVRFTATVTADGSGVPTGVVVFFDGDRAIGTAAVHGPGPSVTAVLATLDLAIGDHEIAAEFHGSHGFLGSRSQAISQTITRH